MPEAELDAIVAAVDDRILYGRGERLLVLGMDALAERREGVAETARRQAAQLLELRAPAHGIVLQVMDPHAHVRAAHREMQHGVPLEEPLLGAHTVRDVARVAAAVDDLAVLEMGVDGEQDVEDRSVPAAQPRGILVQRLAREDPREERIGRAPVGMELADVMAQILVRRASEQRELGGVRPADDAVGSHHVDRNRSVLGQVRELALTMPEGELDPSMGAQRLFERCRLLLQVGDRPHPFVDVRQSRESLRGRDARVRSAQPPEMLLLGARSAVLEREGTEERKGIRRDELVPQAVELDRSLVAARLPQQRHHLAENGDPAVPPGHRGEEPVCELEETRPVRAVAVHDPRECLRGIEHDELPALAQRRRVEAEAAPSAPERRPVRFGDDQDDCCARFDSVLHEAGDRLQQDGFVVVELGEVLALARTAPARLPRVLLRPAKDAHFAPSCAAHGRGHHCPISCGEMIPKYHPAIRTRKRTIDRAMRTVSARASFAECSLDCLLPAVRW